MALENLESLKNDMVSKNWTISSFIFHYKRIEYIVLVKLFVDEKEIIEKNALLKLHFMKSRDLKDDLLVEASRWKLLIHPKELRQYFGIEYKENLGDILRQFTDRLGNFIPKKVPSVISAKEKAAMVYSLSNSDSEDPDKIYCAKVRRNPDGGKRSPYNADKTKLLRSALFEHFQNEPNVSFCYSADSSKENDDATILRNFAKNGSK